MLSPIPRRQPPKKRRAKPRPGRLTGKALEQLRRDCFERDTYQCRHQTESEDGMWMVSCLNKVTWESGHMAYIVSRGRGGKDELPNVVTKCAGCHIGIEHSYGPSGVKPCPPKVKP
jgi:5-methylcytosine-specific restriction endonuclease McrA